MDMRSRIKYLNRRSRLWTSFMSLQYVKSRRFINASMSTEPRDNTLDATPTKKERTKGICLISHSSLLSIDKVSPEALNQSADAMSPPHGIQSQSTMRVLREFTIENLWKESNGWTAMVIQMNL